MADREIKEAKSLRWLAVQFPKVENPKDDVDKMQNCINLYCTNAADFIIRQQATIDRYEEDIERLRTAFIQEVTDRDDAKAEAIKEFADRLKENCRVIGAPLITNRIDNLVKEMVGE